ncbi:hypothetical protein [Pseudomonas chlororaphis]|uniref:Peptidase C58 YopT-type domain-containing protein n=1 Tax=Pseudomonas chlororaphis TaxID=587753 RepID=A0AAX3FR33_9PSED|nr:hypothetical protein [Pseudomonas chlororaphis]AZC38065.1 hypothetical protein C4K37_3680 [Pseudomonas chlororaphis subsp. piscium]AZC44611.1 hypothetical protein C4K36_3688 [Pseudomonas chlororaphis subsp. piscium]WDG70234.1 hypothetical protein PUP65_19150 [Pseudomonas chlororaphis]WDH31980.1 hypothetical protein PUP81_15170 [Pseudomonas chlororaphis]WDH68760.1 hypothetical protein PUP78_19135 [Pseudomonas chlororaphis]
MSGKLLVKWVNKTPRHPKGVCEAAVMKWLAAIDNNGLAQAMKLTPEQCDDLQDEVEDGGTFTLLLPPMLLPTSSFDPFNSVPPSVNLLKDMKAGNFFFVSAEGKTHVVGGHAMGIYKNTTNLFFFDPEFGIYAYDFNSQADLAEVVKRTQGYGAAAYCPGTFTPPPKP